MVPLCCRAEPVSPLIQLRVWSPDTFFSIACGSISGLYKGTCLIQPCLLGMKITLNTPFLFGRCMCIQTQRSIRRENGGFDPHSQTCVRRLPKTLTLIKFKKSRFVHLRSIVSATDLMYSNLRTYTSKIDFNLNKTGMDRFQDSCKA